MTALRPDLATILRRIEPGARVLDIGCGDGALMAALTAKDVDARGIEIDGGCVASCVAQGLSVVQGDADRDLTFYPDGAFDYAVLSQTLQTAARPDRMMQELLRVGRRAFVSFPNFAYWRMRWALLSRGRMPVTRHLPVSWYETDNIHHVTVRDFELLADALGIAIERRWFFTRDREMPAGGANWRAEYALFEVSGGPHAD
ncbi:methionine biosynthesis protein MetW [Alteriqipengyuania sp. WL0013]|uniref:methionine biosynthesis protein MetW n=1 Tax=Alteriqipengyuania sp. WL0013 TaxID=3110773 RepID=UPI002B623223|nr:methionine biosynthesis protein MetW [Alteriqipengyuania sp. WL0013]MEB3415997.1 methionine biosynthesis protein MetW [Alteriqipengyuania sp. WL0013]